MSRSPVRGLDHRTADPAEPVRRVDEARGSRASGEL